MKLSRGLLIVAAILLHGCASLAPAPVSAQPALPFVLVTAAPDASPTPTPFQPIPWTPTGTLPSQPVIDPGAMTSTPAIAQGKRI